MAAAVALGVHVSQNAADLKMLHQVAVLHELAKRLNLGINRSLPQRSRTLPEFGNPLAKKYIPHVLTWRRMNLDG